MSSVFAALGLDANDLLWQDLALCVGQEVSRFHEDYENSPRSAKVTDDMCLSCPVQRECLQAGIEGNEYGCWGGVYLVNGKVDENRNAHKTFDVWQQIREGLE